MSTIIVIPARLNSSRLPRKVILDLHGKPIVQHVYEKCLQVRGIRNVYIAVDTQEVMEVCLKFTDNVVMTSNKHESGTDRIAEVANLISCDNVINVQGDEPFIDASLLERIVEALESDKEEKLDIVTASCPIEEVNSFKDQNNVKVVVNESNNALYFSRATIPYFREGDVNLELVSKHIGVYGYRKKSLVKFVGAPQAKIEKAEKLEQLRALAMGMTIHVLKTKANFVGIDTYDDYMLAQKVSI